MIRASLFIVWCGIVFRGGAAGQNAVLVPAPLAVMPAAMVDGNSPGFWNNGLLTVYTSTGQPEAMHGPGVTNLSVTDAPVITPGDHYPLWIEAAWHDDDGTVYAWYHHEAGGLCGGKLTAPMIGALVSKDGGHEFRDLGIVLSSGDPLNCAAQNGFFAGGHGDFSVILDRDHRYFYFLFSNYGGPAESQGIGIARMPFTDRSEPLGTVKKLYEGSWDQPGVGGPLTPIVRATVDWGQSNSDSFWGPAVHWNTAIERYAVLLNRACCKTNWPQEGIYIMYSSDLSEPLTWTRPAKLLDAGDIGFAPGYYPQVFGAGVNETDTLGGQYSRLFVKGVSRWLVYFNPPRDPEDTAGRCQAGQNSASCPDQDPLDLP